MKGLPRLGHVNLGKLEDRKMRYLVCLGEVVARPGEPLLLGEGRLRLGELVT